MCAQECMYAQACKLPCASVCVLSVLSSSSRPGQTCLMPHAPCLMPHAPCLMPHPACLIRVRVPLPTSHHRPSPPITSRHGLEDLDTAIVRCERGFTSFSLMQAKAKAEAEEAARRKEEEAR